MVDDLELMGTQIREIRGKIGMSIKELAERLELSVSVVSRIERGQRVMTLGELMKITEALGVSPLAILEPGSLLGRLPPIPRRRGSDDGR